MRSIKQSMTNAIQSAIDAIDQAIDDERTGLSDVLASMSEEERRN